MFSTINLRYDLTPADYISMVIYKNNIYIKLNFLFSIFILLAGWFFLKKNKTNKSLIFSSYLLQIKVITELGCLPPTSVPHVLREFSKYDKNQIEKSYNHLFAIN